MNLYPQTDLNTRNLGWIIDEIKKLQEEITNGGIQVVSSAAQMTNHAVIYVYIGSESGMNTDHWYYWDNPSQTWVDGGSWGGGAVTLPLAISDGGTGSTTASAARTALGITPANIGAVSTNATINISHGGTGATTKAGARSSLEITPANIGAEPAITVLPVSKGGTNASTAAAARSNLGITPANIGAEPAITALPISKGGTGATTVAGARTSLGLSVVTGSLTPNGEALSEIVVTQMGNVVEVKGYATFAEAVAQNATVTIGTIAGVSNPPSIIRTLAGSAQVHAYDATNCAYCSLGTNGELTVKPPIPNQRTFTFNIVYFAP